VSANKPIASINSRDAPDTVFAGYPANPKAGYPVRAGYRISGRILGLTTIFYGKKSNKFINSINNYRYRLLQKLKKT
jgi:hypothetical protein